MNTVFGVKKQQSQVFLEDGTRVPVTVVSVLDNVVSQHKTSEKDGYAAVQLGIGVAKKQKKSVVSHLKKANITTLPKYLREVRISPDEDLSTLSLGTKLELSTLLTPGDQLKVTGVSKGKGFAGGVKRHNFSGGPKTHGQSDRHRAPGAIGQGTTPGRVYKGKRMAGHMGVDTVSVTNLYVVDIKGSDVYVSGLIPGSKNTLIRLEKTGEKKNFIPVFRLEEPQADSKGTEEAKGSNEEIMSEAVSEKEVTEEANVQQTEVETAVEEVKADEVKTTDDTVEAPAEETTKGEEKDNGGK